ncbi:MAG: gamma carbonic anhydrase family protein [Chloroflexota bacterium]
MPVLPYLGTLPTIGDECRMDDNAFVLGKVTLGARARLAAGSVIRGDQCHITIGDDFSLGSGSTIHIDPDRPTTIGDDVVVEERAVVHGCTVGEAVWIQAEATLLTGSSVGAGSILAPDTLIPEGKEIPARSYVAGTPGKVLRATTDDEVAAIRARARGARIAD